MTSTEALKDLLKTQTMVANMLKEYALKHEETQDKILIGAMKK